MKPNDLFNQIEITPLIFLSNHVDANHCFHKCGESQIVQEYRINYNHAAMPVTK